MRHSAENALSKENGEKPPKRFPRSSINLVFAGDLVMIQPKVLDYPQLLRRYQYLFESLANEPRDRRVIIYKLLSSLILTSHAKKADSVEIKKDLFDRKNKLYLSIAQDSVASRAVEFRYLLSNHVRVLKYCESCTKKNEGKRPHQFQHCAKCEVDKTFFNIIAMTHTFDLGFGRIYLSQDMLAEMPFKRFRLKGSLSDYKEEMHVGKYRYTIRNLDSISLESAIKFHEMLAKKYC